MALLEEGDEQAEEQEDEEENGEEQLLDVRKRINIDKLVHLYMLLRDADFWYNIRSRTESQISDLATSYGIYPPSQVGVYDAGSDAGFAGKACTGWQ